MVQNIMLMVAPGEIAYMNRYDNISKTGTQFILQSFDSTKCLVSRMTAQSNSVGYPLLLARV